MGIFLTMTFLIEGCRSFTLSPALFSQRFMLRNGTVAFMNCCSLSINMSVVSRHDILFKYWAVCIGSCDVILTCNLMVILLKTFFFSVRSCCAGAIREAIISVVCPAKLQRKYCYEIKENLLCNKSTETYNDTYTLTKIYAWIHA